MFHTARTTVMTPPKSDFIAIDLGYPEAPSRMPDTVGAALDWKPNRQQLLIIITLAVVSLLVALDASVIITSLNEIVSDLNGDTTEGFWIGTSYLLASSVTMPIIASIGDIFGRPLCLEFALSIFTVGTFFCCIANNITVMLVGRSIQGIGGGGIQVLSGVIMTDIVPLRHRPKWYGMVLAAWALGTCAGPIIGGAIAQNTTWRWVFYLMFPICIYGLTAVPLLLKRKPKTESLTQKLPRVDWVGILLFIGSTTLSLVAICRGGTQQPWNSAATIAPLTIGLALLVITVLWEIHFASEPILKPSLFHDTTSIVTYFCGAVQGFLMWSAFYYYPFYFLSVKMTNPVTAGVNMLPSALVLVPGSVLTGQLVTRYNNYRIPIWFGWFVTVVSAVVSVEWQFVDVTPAVWVTTLMLMGLGHGAILNAQNFATQAMCKEGDEVHAASMYLFIRQIGAAIGVGVGGTTFQNVMVLKLTWEKLPTEIAHNAEAFIAKLAKTEPMDDFRQRVIDAYIFGFGGVFQMYLGIAALSLVLSLIFIKHRTLNKGLVGEHTSEGCGSRDQLVGCRNSISKSTLSTGHWTVESEAYPEHPPPLMPFDLVQEPSRVLFHNPWSSQRSTNME